MSNFFCILDAVNYRILFIYRKMDQTKKKSLIRFAKWTVVAFFLLAVAGAILLFLLSGRLISREISKQIEARTQGAYSITSSDISVNIFSGSISFTGLRMTGNNQLNGSLYFAAETLSIERIKLLKLIFSKKFHAKMLYIDQPLFGEAAANNASEKATDPFSAARQLRLLFGKNLKSIKINEIKFNNAKIPDHFLASSNSLLTRSSFNIIIEQFYTDPELINREGEFFEAEDIFLGIDNYQKVLVDKIHRLKIGRIEYSLKNKGIRGDNIELAPIDSTIQTATRYHVQIPGISIKSADIDGLFQKDSIVIDSLFLRQANIRVIPKEGAPELNLRKIREFDLYQLVEGEFEQLSIKYLSMNANTLRIERLSDEKSSIQQFNNLNIRLENFQLNENSYYDPDKLLYSDELFLEIDRYYLLMNDEVHRFDAENIRASSEGAFINADKLLLKPSQNPRSEITTVDMECDSIRLTGIDLKRLFHNREMPLQSITAYLPAVTIEQGEKQQKDERETSSLLYHFIGNYIRGIYADLVAFEQGKFVINTREEKQDGGVIAFDFAFRLTDFSLDSASAKRSDKLFFATNIELGFSNYRMKLADQIHKLEIGQIDVSSDRNQASIRDFRLFPDEPEKKHELLKKYGRSQIYDIKVPYLVLRNTNIHQAFFRKNLRINNISIVEPDIYFEAFSRQEDQEDQITPREFYELLNNYIENISIGKIAAPKGNVRLVTHSKKGKTISFNNKFSLELENFALNDAEIEKNKLLFSDEFELKLENHLFRLSDNVHNLQASEINVSSRRSEIVIKKAILYPNITSKLYESLPWHLHVSIPEIVLRGVDLEEAYFKQKLAVGHLFIRQPDIKFFRSRNNPGNPGFRKVSFPLPKELQLLSLRQFNLDGGMIKIYNADKFSETEILNSNIAMIGENSSLSSQGRDKPANFESDNISVNLGNLNFTPEKGKMGYTARQVQFSTKEKQLKIEGLLLKSTEKSFQLNLPSLTFENLDLDEAVNNKRFHFSLIQAINPVLTIRQDDDQNPDFDLFQLKLPEGTAPFVNRISAKKISLDNAILNIIKGKKTEEIKNIHLALHDFALDTVKSAELFAARSVHFRLKNYAFSDRRNYYNFHFDELSFDNRNNKFTISGISINPRYSKEQFQDMISFQEDHYRGKIKAIDLLNVDLRRWYSKGELTGSQAVVREASLDIYRDKRTVFNEKQRPKLPQELIKNMEKPFYFDTVKLVNSVINYAEQHPEMPMPSTIFFDQVNISAFPVTNLAYLQNVKPKLFVNARAMLMGKALLETSMTYDLQAADNSFQVKGKLHPFDMTILNPVLINAAGLSVRSGQLNRFEFEFDANSTQSVGKLRFAYDDLKVSILEHKDGDTREDKLASFITNNLVLKSKHPRTRILLPDEIRFTRDQKRSVINYWWKSVFSGVKNTFGIKDDNK